MLNAKLARLVYDHLVIKLMSCLNRLIMPRGATREPGSVEFGGVEKNETEVPEFSLAWVGSHCRIMYSLGMMILNCSLSTGIELRPPITNRLSYPRTTVS